MRRDIGGPPNNRFVGQGPCALRGGEGRRLRIATPVTSVTGFAMTHCKECGGRADVGIGPYEVFTDRIS